MSTKNNQDEPIDRLPKTAPPSLSNEARGALEIPTPPPSEEATSTKFFLEEGSEVEDANNEDAPQNPLEPSAEDSRYKLSKEDVALAFTSVTIMALSSLLSLLLKNNGLSAQDAFNINALGLILAQGIAGPVRFENKFWWPAVTTIASLALLGMTYLL
ncbi:hypothetical protein [Lysobacter enzymogenes]|uniref:hypothetical protein n=1 Tax=Lysobacter enzymogenes TaxID=69 RepID=UPI000F4BC52F|nr:hypothetical protein [Lysobacter enzymogenes]